MNNRPISSPSLVKLGPRTPENRWAEMPIPKIAQRKRCSIVNYSAVEYSISLKFCSKFKRMTPEMLLNFKVNGSKVKVTA